MRILYLLLFSFFLATGQFSIFAQAFQFNSNWYSVGPNKIPENSKQKRDAGIGPIEFIRASEIEPGHLLAGSLSGGLFYSENNGMLWKNAGSDDWDHSGCPWADFHPSHKNVWFGVSNKVSDNGKPGNIGFNGGLYRKKSSEAKWDLIGGYKDFGASQYVTIYGTRFHPKSENKLYVLTSKGLFVTENCMANFVDWTKVAAVDGLIYDMDFVGDLLFVSSKNKNEWNVTVIDEEQAIVKNIALPNKEHEMRHLTFEPQMQKGKLLILQDFTAQKDQLLSYDIATENIELISKNERVNFGSGHTLAISPYDENEYYIGNYTRLQKRNLEQNKNLPIGNEYHVDVEFVRYSPHDTSTLFIATHGGIYASVDNGLSWEDRSVGLGVAEVMSLSVGVNDSRQISIGCYHDGSMLLADHEGTSEYTWRTINGGDGLNTIINPIDNNIVYSSNQYTGGGLHYSANLGKDNQNIHAKSGLKSAGWEMAVVLNPENTATVYFNFLEKDERNKGNINISRIENIEDSFKSKRISDFNRTHGLEHYKVYGLFNSSHYPNLLFAYVLNYKKDANGKQTTEHLLFRTLNANGSPEEVIESWEVLQHPVNNWIADLKVDEKTADKIYLSYLEGNNNPETIFGDKGMVFTLKYTNKGKLKRQWDITKNIPNSLAGRNNLVYVSDEGGYLFIATETGVYYGRSKVLKGKSRWQKVGEGLPHCKVYGLEYDKVNKQLIVGTFGRGVWRYNL